MLWIYGKEFNTCSKYRKALSDNLHALISNFSKLLTILSSFIFYNSSHSPLSPIWFLLKFSTFNSKCANITTKLYTPSSVISLFDISNIFNFWCTCPWSASTFASIVSPRFVRPLPRMLSYYKFDDDSASNRILVPSPIN